MPRRVNTPSATQLEPIADWQVTWASLIARVTAAYLTVGILAFAAWAVTGNQAWAVEFFRVPAALLMVCLALSEFGLSSQVVGHFSDDDLLRPGWTLIACSAGCQLAGTICSQVLGVQSRINPLVLTAGAGSSLIPLMRNIGLTVGGTFRFGLLAAGLHFALKAYRQANLMGRLKWMDGVVLGGFAVFLLRNVADVAAAMRAGKAPDAWEVLGWPVDLLLWVLLFQALRLARAAGLMGNGRIALCWKAYSAGVFLTALGDIGTWATNYGYLNWPWAAAIWYLWLPAAAAFARAPAFQLAVMRDARAVAGSLVCEVLKASES